MELGIDVGDIDQVFQIGCPRSISSTMQRLGRAGHNPNRISIMHMFPREAVEGLYCGLTAEVARNYSRRRIFPSQNRIVIKDYPKEAAEALSSAGFVHEPQGYVAYRPYR